MQHQIRALSTSAGGRKREGGVLYTWLTQTVGSYKIDSPLTGRERGVRRRFVCGWNVQAASPMKASFLMLPAGAKHAPLTADGSWLASQFESDTAVTWRQSHQ